MKYEVLRTDTADAGIRRMILYVAQNFGNDVAIEKLDEIEDRITILEDDPYIGVDPKYPVLKRQGYKVLILEKDLVFYKIDEDNKKVIIYAVVDQRQDYLNIIRGLCWWAINSGRCIIKSGGTPFFLDKKIYNIKKTKRKQDKNRTLG